MILGAKRLTVGYPDAGGFLLREIDFSVGAREFVALVGPNGSGKTTLVRALLGLVAGAEGEQTLDGRPLDQWSVAERATVVGLLPQREESSFGWRVDELVMFGRYARLGPLARPGAADRAAVAQAMARADVTHLSSRPIDTLSGGEWQRVRIARALAQEPRVLILDEPNAGLDVGHAMDVFELVRALVDDGMAAIVVTHDLNLAARFADRITMLHRGQIAASGPPSEVMTKPVLEQVFEWPVDVATLPSGEPQLVPRRRYLSQS